MSDGNAPLERVDEPALVRYDGHLVFLGPIALQLCRALSTTLNMSPSGARRRGRGRGDAATGRGGAAPVIPIPLLLRRIHRIHRIHCVVRFIVAIVIIMCNSL